MLLFHRVWKCFNIIVLTPGMKSAEQMLHDSPWVSGADAEAQGQKRWCGSGLGVGMLGSWTATWLGCNMLQLVQYGISVYHNYHILSYKNDIEGYNMSETLWSHKQRRIVDTMRNWSWFGGDGWWWWFIWNFYGQPLFGPWVTAC